MPSVYNYRHVELDKVGRGKRVIKPPGGETADIFGSRSEQPSYSSASSQAGSDVASSRVHIEADQQSIGGLSSTHQPVDGLVKASANGQVSPNGSIDSGASGRPIQQQQPLLMADDFKPIQQETMQNQQQPMHLQQQKLVQMQQQEVNRSPKKTIPVIRRNPITGEIYDTPSGQPAVVRVRQPPGGRSSGIF